jgi:hypothetical protein
MKIHKCYIIIVVRVNLLHVSVIFREMFLGRVYYKGNKTLYKHRILSFIYLIHEVR